MGESALSGEQFSRAVSWVARGQRKALAVPSGDMTDRMKRSLAAPPADGVSCSHCSRATPVKADGTLRRHNSRPGISCPGGGEPPK